MDWSRGIETGWVGFLGLCGMDAWRAKGFAGVCVLRWGVLIGGVG